MCIIASVPKDATIDKPTLETMWKHNSDGAGISWIDEKGKVRVYKTMKLKPFLSKFDEISKRYGKEADILVHMRIATHGSVCMDNNHPFNVDTQTVFAHNGILPRQFHPPAKRDISDTRYFNETFLQYQKLSALDDSRYIDHLGEVIGSYNKLVILTANPKMRRDSYIINETSGEWSDGVWYSNDSYLELSAKMKWGTRTYVTKLSDTTKPTTKSDVGSNCSIADLVNTTGMPAQFDIEVCDQWGLVHTDDWADDEIRETIMEMMNVYGYDTPQDMLEDFLWHVRDGKLQCQQCKAKMDINSYWPDCDVTCTNFTDGKELTEMGDFENTGDDGVEVAPDVNSDWFEVADDDEKMIQQELFGKEK